MLKVNNIFILPSVFPDKTTQVWNLPEEIFTENAIIDWVYDGDAEFMSLVQVVQLLRTKGTKTIHLHMEYLPYARQDKAINNESTFGLYTFAWLLNSLQLNKVTFIDAHSDIATNIIANSVNLQPDHIYQEIDSNKYNIVIFPDKGAANRYCTKNPSVSAEKKRDQTTAKIVGLELPDLKKFGMIREVLVVDDICDAGGTFIKLIPLIKEQIPNANVHLIVSHLIQASAIDNLKKAGYKTIRDKKGEYK